MNIDIDDFRVLGPNWKITIPLYILLIFLLALIAFFILSYSFWTLFVCFIILVPILDIMQRIFEFLFSGR